MTIGNPNFSDVAYARMLMNLFPAGAAFPRNERDSLFKLLLGLAQELLRLDGRSNALIKESFPDEADEMISEHEVDLGFPDEVFEIPVALDDRQVQCLERTTWPLFLPTGFTGTASVEAGSDIVEIEGDITALLIGDGLYFPMGFKGGKYRVMELIDSAYPISHWRMEQAAEKTAADFTVTAYFLKAEPSERFFRAVAIWLSCGITSFTYYDDTARAGLVEDASISGCNCSLNSNLINNISDTSEVRRGSYVVAQKGFGLKAWRVRSWGEHFIALEPDVIADASYTGIEIKIFSSRPFGMGDELGGQNQYRVIVHWTGNETNGAKFRAFMNKIKPARVIFEFINPA